MRVDIHRCIGEEEVISCGINYDAEPGDSFLFPFKSPGVWLESDGKVTNAGLEEMRKRVKEDILEKIDGIKITFVDVPPLCFWERIQKAISILRTGKVW